MADLPRTPITRQEEYLSRLAGENTTLPREPITREEMYLEGAIARVEAVEEEVEEIKNNPDVVDIVGTYADLQSYDTQHLTENDIIRVLQDETHSGNSTYYRLTKNPDTWTFIGEITGGGGEPIVLTTADYNYPESTPDGIAIWTLDEGEYVFGENVKLYKTSGQSATWAKDSYLKVIRKSGTMVHYSSDSGKWSDIWMSSSGTSYSENNFLYGSTAQGTGTSTTNVMSQNAVTNMVYKDPSTKKQIQLGDSAAANGIFAVAVGGSAVAKADRSVAIGVTANTGNNFAGVALGAHSIVTRAGEVNVGTGNYSFGYNNTAYRIIGGVHDGVDNHDVATVAQGNTLSASAPTASTEGVLGQLWTDTTNMHTYQCTAVNGDTYTWTQRW